jgi:hypothetical protein
MLVYAPHPLLLIDEPSPTQPQGRSFAELDLSYSTCLSLPLPPPTPRIRPPTTPRTHVYLTDYPLPLHGLALLFELAQVRERAPGGVRWLYV